MINSVNSRQDVENPAGGQNPQISNAAGQVNFRRGNKYERTADNDTFVSENKKPKKRGAKIIGCLALPIAVVGGICLRKGGKVLEGEKATMKEKISAGWKELTGKMKKVAEEKAAKEAEEKVTKEAEEKAAKKAEEKAAKKAEENVAKEEFEKDMAAREQRAAEWRQKAQDKVDAIREQLSGKTQATFEVNSVTQAEREQMLKDAKASTNKLVNSDRKVARDQYRKDIDSILNRNEIKDLDTLYAFKDKIMTNGTKTQKELFDKMEKELKAAAEYKEQWIKNEAVREAQAAEWKANTDKIVGEFEKRLDGSGYMETVGKQVPKKRTNFEHKELQKVYDKELSAELQAAEWKANTDKTVGEFEKKLDGSTQIAYRKSTKAEHKAKQAYYDSLSDEIAAHNDKFRIKELERENEILRSLTNKS